MKFLTYHTYISLKDKLLVLCLVMTKVRHYKSALAKTFILIRKLLRKMKWFVFFDFNITFFITFLFSLHIIFLNMFFTYQTTENNNERRFFETFPWYIEGNKHTLVNCSFLAFSPNNNLKIFEKRFQKNLKKKGKEILKNIYQTQSHYFENDILY